MAELAGWRGVALGGAKTKFFFLAGWSGNIGFLPLPLPARKKCFVFAPPTRREEKPGVCAETEKIVFNEDVCKEAQKA